MYKIWSQTVPCIIIIGNLSIMITIFRYESPSLPSIKIFLTSKISYWKILLLHHRLKSVCCKEINISSSIEFHVWNPIEEENLKKNWKLMWCWLNEAKKKEYKKKKKKEYEVLCSNDLQNRNFDRYSSISLIIVKGKYLIL